MRTIIILAALAVCAFAGSIEKLEKNIHDRMHISEQAVKNVAKVKQLVEEIEAAKAKGQPKGPNVETKEDPKLPVEPSEFRPHKPDPDTFDDDEEMTEEQANEKLEEEMETNTRRKRQFQTNRNMMWPTKIDFYIDKSTLAPSIVPLVKEGTKWFNDHTCFTLREVSSKSQARKPYITYSGGSWCQSYVGKVTNSEQVVQMVEACGTVGTIIHETLHALGFYHEQSRSDRDQYVSIMLNNVKSSARGNFRKSDTKNFQFPYIFGSVMAYPGKAFSVDGRKQTIVAEDQKYQRSMGHRVTGSFADARRINTAYECMDKCPSGANCKNGGFRSPKNCNRCECPEAFTGNDCSQFQPRIDPTGSNNGCGGTEQISSSSEKKFVLKADSGRQDKAHYCTTKFEAPAGKVIKFRMAKENGDWMPCSGGCNWGYVELNAGVAANGGRDFGLPGYRDCCVDQIDRNAIKTDSNVLLATAFAKRNSAKLTLYVSAVGGGGGGTTSRTTRGTTRGTTRRTTRRTTARATTSSPNGGGKKCTRKSRYSFPSSTAYNNARKCSNNCRSGYSTKGYPWYINCYWCCWDKYSK